MSNIHYIILIVALWAIYLIFIFLFKSEKEYQKKVKELEKTLKGIKEKKETWELEPKVDQKAISDVDYERAKKDMLEKGLKIWERLGTDNK
jgi:uncharacterized protein YoxC